MWPKRRKLLKRITGKEILGTDGLSYARPRLMARAILRRHGQIAVMYAGKFDVYTLPGGGVEEGETIIKEILAGKRPCGLGRVYAKSQCR